MNSGIMKQLSFIRDARQRLLLMLQSRTIAVPDCEVQTARIAVEKCKIALAEDEIALIQEAQREGDE